MTFTLQELAKMCGGELVGDPSLQITGAASLGEAVPGEISFYSNPRYGTLLRKTRASAVFVPPDFAESIATVQIRVANLALGLHDYRSDDRGVLAGSRSAARPSFWD